MGIRSTPSTRNLQARKSSVPTIGKGKPLDARGDEGDLTFRRSSEGLKLYIKANHKWHGIKVGESFDSLEKKINEIKSKVDTIKQFRLPSTYSVTGDFTLDASGDIELNADGGQVAIKDASASHFLFDCDSTEFTIYDDQDAGDLFSIQVAQHGATTIKTIDDDATSANLTLQADGQIFLKSSSGTLIFYDVDDHPNFKIDGEYIHFNGSNSDAGDGFRVRVEANGVTTISTNHYALSGSSDAANMTLQPDGHLVLTAATDHHIKLERGAGFAQEAVTYDATDTDVDFKDSNKQYLALTGNVTDLNLKFPSVSGNFVLLIKQDGSTRTITNYKVFDSGGSSASGSSTVKFPAATNPDLTDGGNKVDIISLYWDATNEICYGVASLNF